MSEAVKPKTERLAEGLHALAVFRELLDEEVVAALAEFLNAGGGPRQRAGLYCGFVARLYRQGGDLGNHLLRRLLCSDNPVARLRAKGEKETPEMAASLARELAFFSELAKAGPACFSELAGGCGELPAFTSTPHDFAAAYGKRLACIHTAGFGVFAEHHLFTLAQNGALLPVKNPDMQRFDQMAGYERERGAVEENTKALLRGLPAHNVLLYGDAGTGKSSTVKALANKYCGEGLRLVELRKDQLLQIPMLMGSLADNPLRFILFIDDLSFPANAEAFTELKAILEGGISARPKNVAVYATSNRRHMIAEHFADRNGAWVHQSDTVEEQTSLAARFGVTVTFLKPGRELYAAIVTALAAQYGVAMGAEALLAGAEAHALRCGGRSPRVARQFVEQVKAGQALGALY